MRWGYRHHHPWAYSTTVEQMFIIRLYDNGQEPWELFYKRLSSKQRLGLASAAIRMIHPIRGSTTFHLPVNRNSSVLDSAQLRRCQGLPNPT